MNETMANNKGGQDAAAEQLLELLRGRGLTFCAAESCTGGLINQRLTAIPGSSDVVEGGVVSYSNNVKMRLLGVSAEALLAYGAVSVQVVAQMADGVRRATGADIAVSVTGIAGPGGGSAEKPVGTVCFGIATASGVRSLKKQFDSTLQRDAIRWLASELAIALAAEAAKEGAENA